MSLEQEHDELHEKIDLLEHEIDTSGDFNPLAEKQLFLMRELIGIIEERIAECEDS